MRWNCPHCSTALAITDEKLGTGWTFTRCYKCGGFGLVRRSESSQIKVDAAPTAEKIVEPLPPRPELLSEKALQNLARPVILPSARNRVRPATPVTSSFSGSLPDSLVDSMNPSAADPIASVDASAPRTVSPFAASILVLVAISIGSGIYLVNQGRTLLRQLSQPETAAAPARPDRPELATIVDRVEQTASAPIPAAAPAQAGTLPKGLKAHVRVASAALRSAPNIDATLVARSPLDARFEVIGWRENWFEIKLPPSTAAQAPETAWIRNDLVQLVTR